MNKVTVFLCSIISSMLSVSTLAAQPNNLVSFQNVSESFVGAFKIKHMDGVSSTSFSSGRMAYNPKNHSVFLSSHAQQDAIGEFKVPNTLSMSVDIAAIPDAVVLQEFSQVHLRASTGMTQGINTVGGLSVIGGKLYAQYYQGYDAAGSITHTTLVVDNPDDLAGSKINGFYEMDGAARTVNYISPIPSEWRAVLGGDQLAGNGDGMSIVSRLSNGPSLYSFTSNDFGSSDRGAISTTAHLDYPLSNALSSSVISLPDNIEQVDGYGRSWDAFNLSGQNDLWTESSAAWYGFIIPGTATFAAIGQQGMHNSGGGYKNTQDNGYLCGGPCPNKYDDWDTYYWLYDLNEIVSAANPYDVLPYEYGVFDNRFLKPFRGGVNGLPSSASWDPNSGILYVAYRNGAGEDQYAPHIIGAYDLGHLSSSRAAPPPGFEAIVR